MPVPRGSSGIASLPTWLALVGAVMLVVAVFRQEPAPQGPGATTPVGARAVAPMPASRPVSLSIPGLGVHASVERLGVDDDQRLEVPSDPSDAGWYRESSTPGAAGAAVIAGHVTWSQEPAVFFDLGRLAPSQRVHVLRADGRTAIFAITRVEQYSKAEFPTARVYRAGVRPVLRLITCGGTYDAAHDTYTDNVVVYGTLVDSRA